MLVNNAGQGDVAPFAETPREMWDRMLAVNLTGTCLCTREVLSRDARRPAAGAS